VFVLCSDDGAVCLDHCDKASSDVGIVHIDGIENDGIYCVHIVF